jgi:hypothetical protein
MQVGEREAGAAGKLLAADVALLAQVDEMFAQRFDFNRS